MFGLTNSWFFGSWSGVWIDEFVVFLVVGQSIDYVNGLFWKVQGGTGVPIAEIGIDFEISQSVILSSASYPLPVSLEGKTKVCLANMKNSKSSLEVRSTLGN